MADATGPTRVELNWTASQDDVGVAAYAILRDDSEIGSTTGTTYRDDGVSANTSYRYTIVALDPTGKTGRIPRSRPT